MEKILYPDKGVLKYTFILVGVGVYIALFIALYPLIGAGAGLFSIVPIFLAAWYFGVLGGVALGLAVNLVSTFLVFYLSSLGVASLQNNQIIGSEILLILLAGLAGYLSILARKNRNLQEAENNRRTHSNFMELLNEITAYALEADDLTSMFKLLAPRIGDLFNADSCIISLWNPEEGTPVPMASFGTVSEEFSNYEFDPEERTLAAAVLNAGHAIVVENTHRSAHVSLRVARLIDAASMLGLPLIAGDQKLGAVILGYNKPRRFEQEIISQGEMAARQISLAMTKVHLLEDAVTRVRELSGLHEIALSFGSVHDVSEIYGILSERLARLIDARMCVVGLLDETRDEIQAQLPGYGIPDEDLVAFQYSAEIGAEVWDFTQRDVFYANSVDQIPPGFEKFIRLFGIESVIVAPMRSEGQLYGMVYAANKPGGFTGDDAHLMGIFAGQAAGVIQSARLLETIRRQAQRQSALLKLSTELAASMDVKDICRRVVIGLHDILHYDHLALFLVDDADGSRVLQASAGWPGLPDGYRLPEGKGLSYRPQIDGKLHFTPDVSKEAEYITGMAGSEVDVPVRIGVRIGGILVAESQHKNAFNQADFDVLTAAANLAGLALTRAQSVFVERRQFEELAILHAVAMAGTEATNEDDLIERVTSIIGQSLYPDNFGILLLDESRNGLIPHPTYHISVPYSSDPVPLGKGVTGQVAASGRSRLIPDVSKAADYIGVDPNTHSELCVPIRIGDRVIGVVNTESRKVAGFTPQDERILSTLAGQLATSIERLRTAEVQYHQSEKLARSNALISALAQVAARIERASEPEGVMHALGDELEKLGLISLVALRIPGSQEFLIQYTSLEPAMLRKLERIAGTELKDFRIPLDRFLKKMDRVQPPRPVIWQDSYTVFNDVLTGFTRKSVERLLRPAGISTRAPLGHFPLTIEDRLFGFLWLWGDDLKEADLPALSIFANQVAVALENARLFAEVQNLAITDAVTGIHNRRHAYHLALKEFNRARRYGRALSVIVVDVDHFKGVNDTYGHAAGDRVLQYLADLCRKSLRDIDILGRFGGEEFVIILPETELSGGIAVAERLRENIARMAVHVPRGIISVTVSAGVAGLDDNASDLDQLIDNADRAMYVAKRAGRNRVSVNG